MDHNEVMFRFEEDRDEYRMLRRRMELLVLRNSSEYIYGSGLDDLEERYADVLNPIW